MFGKKALRNVLCGFAALAMISAAGRPAKADDDPSAKVHAKALLRVALNEKMLHSANGQNLQIEFDIYKNTQRQLLLSPFVHIAALRRPEIGKLAIIKRQKNPVDWLSKNLQITFPGNSEIMEISLSGASSKELAILVNAVVDAYLSEVVDRERVKREVGISDLKRICFDKTQEVKNSLNELRRMAESLGTSETETLNIQQKNTLDELQLNRAELLRCQFEVNRMKGELASRQAALQAVESSPISDTECMSFAASDIILKKLGEELVARQIAADPKDKTELERLQNMYDQRLEKIRDEIKDKNRADVEKEIKKIEAANDIASKQQATTLEDVKRLRKEADRFGLSSIDMQMRREDIKNRQRSLDALSTELETMRVEANSPPRVTLLEKAEVPE